MHILEFTPERRRELFNLGKSSLFAYCNGILGFPDMTDSLHWEYCAFLERPSIRKLIFMFRGGLKSSIGNVGFVSWRSLYIPNHATKLVEASSDNAKKNHFKPLVELFTRSSKADFLWWLYGDYGQDDLVDDKGIPLDQDMRRLPQGYAGTNNEQFDLIRDGTLTLPTVTYGGINTAYEGWHGDLILGDDLEGADEDKAVAPNDDAWHFVDSRATPLLKEAGKGMIVVIGTPHGPSPVIHRIKDRELEWRAAGNAPVWDVFWRPLIDSSGQCAWPERFPSSTVNLLRQSKKLWKTQYQGEIWSDTDTHFDLAKIRANAYRWQVPNRLMAYTRQRFERTATHALVHDETGFPKIVTEQATISPQFLRTYLHCDPKHVKGARHSDDEAAMMVVGVNWDQHVFVLHTWSGDVGLEEFAERLYTLYRKYRPWGVSMGAVGAEHWFEDYARALERGKYRHIPSLPYAGLPHTMLPRLTSRFTTTKNHTHQAKDDWIVRQLESWLSIGFIHCREEDEALYTQIGNIGQAHGRRDLIDCLAQGPSIWKFPRADSPQAQKLLTPASTFFPADPDTGYFNPFAENPLLPPPGLDSPGSHPLTRAYQHEQELARGGNADGPLRNPHSLPPEAF